MILLALAWDGWIPYGYCLGWTFRLKTGEKVALLEHVRVWWRYRGKRKYLLSLAERWFALCKRKGFQRMVTRIETKRPGVAKVGMRWAGYKKWGTEGDFEWFYRDLN